MSPPSPEPRIPSPECQTSTSLCSPKTERMRVGNLAHCRAGFDGANDGRHEIV